MNHGSTQKTKMMNSLPILESRYKEGDLLEVNRGWHAWWTGLIWDQRCEIMDDQKKVPDTEFLLLTPTCSNRKVRVFYLHRLFKSIFLVHPAGVEPTFQAS